MIHIDCEQNSDEWYRYHIGVPSSSEFKKIVTSTGKRSEQRKKYLYRLAGEILSGQLADSYESWAMKRGKEKEEEARQFYALRSRHDVGRCGICFTDDRMLASSPDAFVGNKGLLEIKCPIMETHVKYLDNGKLPTEYFVQVQGQLYVTGRKWVDFISYYPGLMPLIIRVEPDIGFITTLIHASFATGR